MRSPKAWAWVARIGASDPLLFLIDKTGTAIPNGDYRAKVIRSGYRNLAASPVAQISSKTSPIVNNGSNDEISIDQSTNILAASAVEYDEEWQMRPPVIEYANELGNVISANLNKCKKFSPDITNDVKYAQLRMVEAMAVAGKLNRGSYTFTLSSLVGQASFTNSDLTHLQNSLVNPISGTVYVDVESRYHHPRWPFNGVTYLLVFRDLSSSVINRAEFSIASKNAWGWDNLVYSVNSLDVNQLAGIIDGCSNLQLLPHYSALAGPHAISITTQQRIRSINAGAAIIPVQATLGTWYMPFLVGDTSQDPDCPVGAIADVIGARANPYVAGLRGNWRPENSYTYLGERNYTSANAELRTDGEFTTFDPYWQWSGTELSLNSGASTFDKWTSAATITKTDEFGNEVENKDALGIYSSALFESNGNLAIAVGGNAQYGQIAYDGFDHYDNIVSVCPINEYFGVQQKIADARYSLSDDAHTGSKSLSISPTDTLIYTFDYNTNTPAATTNDMPYTLKEADILGNFGHYESSTTEKFLVSYWIKENNSTTVLNDYTGITLSSNVLTVGPPIAKSKVIEGWQKIDQYITIAPGSATDVELHFKNTNSTNSYLIDDIRIQPVNSSMKSFVYDFQTMRFIAELDENNYATFMNMTKKEH